MTQLAELELEPFRASDPLGIACSRRRLLDVAGVPGWLHWLWSFIPGWRGYHRDVSAHLTRNDSRAALVVSVAPLWVAAYTDELDCVAILEFRQFLVDRHQLDVGSRLVTVNGYWRDDSRPSDLIPGPNARDNWTDFLPMIADFLSPEAELIEARKQRIEDSEWQRCAEAAAEHLEAKKPHRGGEPMYADAAESRFR